MDSTLLSEKIKSKLSSYLNYTFSKAEISKILKEMNSFLSYEIILEDTENKLLYSDLEAIHNFSLNILHKPFHYN